MKPNKSARAWIYLPMLILVSGFATQGCAPMEGFGTSSNSLGSQSSIEAFKAQGSVYPLVRQYCASCHSTAVAPFFAAGSAETAFPFAIQKVNFSSVSQSRLVQRLGESHNCWSNCAQDQQAMIAAVQTWKNLAAGGGGGDSYITLGAVTIPATLPTGANFTALQFPLDAQGFAGARFEIEIQDFNGDYRVRNPRILTPTLPIHAVALRLKVNGLVRANEATYITIDLTATPSATPTVLSPLTMIMARDQGPGVDTLAPAFVGLD